MKKSHVIHRENCASSVKDVIKVMDTIYMLLGTYAYEWKIMTKTEHGIFITEYKCCKDARKEWKRKKNLTNINR